MTIYKFSNQISPKRQFEEELLAAERKHDINLLLGNLARNQEATIKLILDCLYDIGSVKLINRKFRPAVVNRPMRAIARFSKPAFRVFAFRWFVSNCPELITNWLYKKVSFENASANSQTTQDTTVDVASVEAQSRVELELASREIQRLRSQVKWLRGISVGAIATLGITVIWVSQHFQLAPSSVTQQAQCARFEQVDERTIRTSQRCD
jgi:hypothetical protein